MRDLGYTHTHMGLHQQHAVSSGLPASDVHRCVRCVRVCVCSEWEPKTAAGAAESRLAPKLTPSNRTSLLQVNASHIHTHTRARARIGQLSLQRSVPGSV